MFDLTGKVALITGSTKGIGKSIAEEMARAGAKVVVSSRKADAVEKVTKELTDARRDAIGIPCNIGSKEDLQNLVDKTLAKWGRIDILVCNAAINPHFGSITKVTDEVFDKMMGSNIRSIFWLANMVLPQMAERKDGAMVIISSIAALRGSNVNGLYGVTKAADAGLGRALAVEWGPHNIRVNSIAPGLIKTDFARALWEDEERRKRREGMTPLRRLGDAKDIGGVAVFLASDAARFMTGQLLVIDGGVSVGW
ncbi:MAG TPA: SDR family oxidoreductase [Burkholderiales bacterium]|nr:SDR family oxidoreductase [Burkholderiales bacterium]